MSWGIAYRVKGEVIFMSVPFENPYMSEYDYATKKEAEEALEIMRKTPGEYVPYDAFVARKEPGLMGMSRLAER